jgi:hypothetical protein
VTGVISRVADRLDPKPNPYLDDPVAWVHDVIRWGHGEGPTEYQDRILAALAEHHRVAVRGPHGLGKTALDAWVVLWFATTREQARRDWKLPTTASAWRQLTHFLWPEIRHWARRINWAKLGRSPFAEGRELLQLNLKLFHGEAFAAASDNPAQLEGAHAASLLYLFDEAKIIPGETFDAAEGAFSGAGDDTTNEAFALATSTPGEPNGRFYDIHRRATGLEDWHPIHVTLDDAIKAGRISRIWADQRAQQWGRTSATYLNRVEGEFAASDEDAVIPLAWIEAANERWRTHHDRDCTAEEHVPDCEPAAAFTCAGVDVARSGSDKTVLALRHGRAIHELRRYTIDDTMVTAGYVAGVLRAHPGGYAMVDLIGIGAGVYDRLQEQHLPVRPFNAGERTDIVDASGELGFVNKRSAAWWGLRTLLDPANSQNLELPPDDRLTGDLTAPKWRMKSGGKIAVESKDDIRKRISRSTDDGDAVVQAFWWEPDPIDELVELDDPAYEVSISQY